jgi:hypothetical protein
LHESTCGVLMCYVDGIVTCYVYVYAIKGPSVWWRAKYEPMLERWVVEGKVLSSADADNVYVVGVDVAKGNIR